MAIRRAKRDSNFTMISNVGLKDNRLSFKAKGLLSYMLSLPDDWIFYESEIVNHATDGKQSVRTGMKELEKFGYLVKEQKRNSKGKFAKIDWVVSDEPINGDTTTFQPSTTFPSTDNPSTDKRATDNRTLLSTNELSTNKQSTNKESPDSTNVKYDDDSPYLGLAKYLFTKVKENNSKAREPNFQNWADDIRKLVEIDGNTVEEVKEVIDWCQSDSFWKNNVMSANKLRTQFPKLWGQGGFENKGSIGIEDLWGD